VIGTPTLIISGEAPTSKVGEVHRIVRKVGYTVIEKEEDGKIIKMI